MGRSMKRSGKKRRAKITFNSNTRKNKWRAQKKARQQIGCSHLEEEWDGTQNAKTNMDKMGLAYDINKIMKVPSAMDELKKLAKGSSKDADMSESNGTIPSTKSKKQSSRGASIEEKEVPAKTKVVLALEHDAALATEETKKKRQLRLSQPEIRYCIYMMEKFDDDYERMARDPKNVYQDTAAQIRRKIETFKSIPIQFNAYLRSKGLLTENGAVEMETN